MFSKQLLRDLESYHLLKHPFYQAWMQGELTLPALRNYAAQYYPHVLAFPQYVSTIHGLCPDESVRRALARNLGEEEGIETGNSHPDLWLRFGEGLGLGRETIRSAVPQPKAQKLRDGYFEICRSSYSEGLAALFAYEYQVPEIAKTKIDGLKKHYGVESEDALGFFRVHEEADLHHSNECGIALDRLSESERPRTRDAAVRAARLLWDFLSEAHVHA